MDKDTLSESVDTYYGERDICPIMSIGQKEVVLCTRNCAWYDTDKDECAVSRINGGLKDIADITQHT